MAGQHLLVQGCKRCCECVGEDAVVRCSRRFRHGRLLCAVQVAHDLARVALASCFRINDWR